MTHLVAANEPLDDHATLRNAVLHWRTNLDVRQPICIGCKARFFGTDAKVGAFLLSTPVGGPDIVATSAFCTSCHETLPLSEVDAISTRVLRALSPNGRFLDAR
ncbi:hypothetical protein HU675_0016195 [Bradyrhizobium septentrionale]|uniref:hypothetical protein n=1 Tax=Bradyrhizobium septentrionale TaxID=1404411 RepID=UPI001596940D|nr:hypothetical protein [Bradyrhizobium septentrionale]UGY28170.1 hypothetical protein HU675_0016195 [Bradyrhizobium septentrionale]